MLPGDIPTRGPLLGFGCFGYLVVFVGSSKRERVSESMRKRDREQVDSSAFIRAGCRAARLKLGIDVWRINCKLDISISRLVHATSERLPAAHQCQGKTYSDLVIVVSTSMLFIIRLLCVQC